jgi:hypothetical protein
LVVGPERLVIFLVGGEEFVTSVLAPRNSFLYLAVIFLDINSLVQWFFLVEERNPLS